MSDGPITEFEKASRDRGQSGFFREYWEFLRQNKKWWLLPILAVLMLLGALIFFAGSAAAPYIYALF
jgi:hypothetical protein